MKVLVFVLTLCCFSCKKKFLCEACPEPSQFVSATINYTGPVTGDGCDWVVQIDSVQYHPDHLDSSFLTNGLQVKILFDQTVGTFTCGIAASRLPVIQVINIKL